MVCDTKCLSVREAGSSTKVVDCGVMGGRNGSTCNGSQQLVDGCTVDPLRISRLSFFDTYTMNWVKTDKSDYAGFGVMMGDDESQMYWQDPEGTSGRLIPTAWYSLGFATEDQYWDAVNYLNELRSAINNAIPNTERTFIYFGITKLGGVRIFTIGSAPENTTKIYFVSHASTVSSGAVNETRDQDGNKIEGPMFKKDGNVPLRILQQVHPYAPANSRYSNASRSLLTDISPWVAGEGVLIDANGEGRGRGWRKGPRRVPFFDFIAYYHSNPTTYFKALSGCPADELWMGMIEYGWDKSEAKKLIQDTQDYYTQAWKDGVADGSIQMGMAWNGRYSKGTMPTNVFYYLMEKRMQALRGANVYSLAQKILAPWYDELLAAETAMDEAALQALYEVELMIPEEEKQATTQLADHIQSQVAQEKKEARAEAFKKYVPRVLIGIGILGVLAGGYYIYKGRS